MKIYLSLVCFIFISLFRGYSQQITFSPQWTSQSQFAGYYVALEKGFYAEAGLDVNIVHPTQSNGAMSMLKKGSTDIITSELIQAMITTDRDVRLVNLLQTTQHSTLVLISRIKDVKQLSDLSGHRVGTWKVGFNEIPQMINRMQRLGFEWVRFINPINLYISGAIDATLVKSYNEQILFAMSGITPESVINFSDLGFDFPEDGLYVTEEFFNKYPMQCRQFAEASRKGWEWVRNNREEALEIVMKYIKEENVPTNIYVQKWMLDTILKVQEDVKGKTPSYRLSMYSFNRVNDILVEYGIISGAIEYDRFIR